MKPASKPSTLAGRFEALLLANPDAPAFGFAAPDTLAQNGYSRAELWEAACVMSSGITPVTANSHVMLVMPLGKELIAAHLGAQLAGCATSIFTHPSAKLGHEVYQKNLRNALALQHPDVVVTTQEFANDVRQSIATGSSRLVVVDERMNFGSSIPDIWRQRVAEDVAVIQYSSGSTGLQKGVALSNGMVLRQIDQYARFINLNPSSDRVCSWLPLYHDMGLFTAYLMPLVTGTPVIMIDPFKWVQDPVSLLRLIAQEHGTLCWQPNFAFNLLSIRTAEMKPASLDLSSMRGFTNCSEPAFPQTMDHFANVMTKQGLRADAMWVCYAMAENSFAVTACGNPQAPYRDIVIDARRYGLGEVAFSSNRKDDLKIASCGVPIEGTEVQIVDRDTGAPLPPAIVGEVAVRSPYLFKEYLKNSEATLACRNQEGWYFTGDLGFVDDGHLFISGRKKDLIIVAGRNFYPQDLENLASSCEGVLPGRVVALGDRDEHVGTELVILIVESNEEDSMLRKSIANRVRQRIFEELDCPVTDVTVVPARWLHKTSSGKIARSQNLDRYRSLKSERSKIKATPTTEESPKKRLATTLEACAWGFSLALATYAYLIFYVIDRNVSWNIYAGF